MFQWLFMIVMWMGSITLGVIAAAAMVTYMRRTWQLIGEDEDGSTQQQILDGIDQIDTRLQAMTERLERLERPALPESTDLGAP